MRSSGGVRRHSGNAAAAASTALLTSSAAASGTLARSSPVAGFTTSRHSEDCDSVHSPLMKWVSLLAGGAATVMRVTPFAIAKNQLLVASCRNAENNSRLVFHRVPGAGNRVLFLNQLRHGAFLIA